jgi:hypothetical protein
MDIQQGLTVRPEFVEGWTVKQIMIRQGSPDVSENLLRTA